MRTDPCAKRDPAASRVTCGPLRGAPVIRLSTINTPSRHNPISLSVFYLRNERRCGISPTNDDAPRKPVYIHVLYAAPTIATRRARRQYVRPAHLSIHNVRRGGEDGAAADSQGKPRDAEPGRRDPTQARYVLPARAEGAGRQEVAGARGAGTYSRLGGSFVRQC